MLHLRIRTIHPNDYYMRKQIAEQRQWRRISLLRVCEALAPVLTLAVCCRCATVKATYLTACSVAFLLQAVLRGHEGALMVRGWMPQNPKDCIDVIIMSIFLIALLMLALAMFMASPITCVLLYAHPITITKQRSDSEVPGHITQFSSTMYLKSLFLTVLCE